VNSVRGKKWKKRRSVDVDGIGRVWKLFAMSSQWNDIIDLHAFKSH
jgi:predicted transcriptional regulator